MSHTKVHIPPGEGGLPYMLYRYIQSRVKYLHGIPWKSMEIPGIPQNFHGVSMEYPWSSMECHGVPWSIHGVPWNAMEFHGVP